jgi:hypothetical protein
VTGELEHVIFETEAALVAARSKALSRQPPHTGVINSRRWRPWSVPSLQL